MLIVINTVCLHLLLLISNLTSLLSDEIYLYFIGSEQRGNLYNSIKKKKIIKKK